MILERKRIRSAKLRLLVLLAIASVSLGASACGGGNGTTAPSHATPTSTSATKTASDPTATGSGATRSASAGKDADDGDIDSERNDDGIALNFGHPANEADRRAITSLIKRYYATAAAGDGVKACSLIYFVWVEAIPEDYGFAPALRGRTCSVVMSKLFKQRHRQLVAQAAGLDVSHTRVQLKKGLALLRFRGSHEPRYIQVHLERSTWRIDGLLARALP
jgi:hypothetical protein